jgi:hypothetical protein
MFTRSLCGALVVASCLVGCGRAPQVETPQLPLRRVVVYRNGVGYFERAGKVDESTITFRMRQKMVGDFLGTLAIVERGGSSVRSASFPIEVQDKFEPTPPPPAVTLMPGATWPPESSKPPKEKNPLREVVLRLDGKEHELAVGYVAETPVWKPSYRVVMHEGGEAELQSWGIVQNLSGEDWKDVDLVLVAGAPLAFQSTLGEPVTPTRPIVSDSGEVIDAMPEAVTSVEQQKGSETERYVPEEQAPAMPQPVAPPSPVIAQDEKLDENAKEAAPARAKKPAASAYRASRDKSGSMGGGAGKSIMMPAPMVSRMIEQSDSSAGAPSAPRNRSMLAGVAVASGSTRYTVPYAITVPDESATMVLLGNQKVPGENVFLFAPDAGVPDSAAHPFRVARFTNRTPGLLERGPIAVFEKGLFLGQGVLDSLPAGGTATVPFALERGLAVQSSSRYDERGARIFKVEGGVLTIERDSTAMTTYAIQNGSSESAKMLVRHPRRPGTRLYRPPAGTEDDSSLGSALVPMSVKPNGKAELVVDERQPQQRQISWLDPMASEAVTAFIKDDRSDKTAVARLSEAWQIRETWRRLVDERASLQIEQGELDRSNQSLRSNLKAIEKNEQAADLRQKLTRKLGESVTRLEQLSKRLVEVDLAIREQEVRFRDSIEGLKILSVPPPRE